MRPAYLRQCPQPLRNDCSEGCEPVQGDECSGLNLVS